MKRIHSFESFLNEGMYQTYADYEKGKGVRMTPDDIRNDAMISVKHIMPVHWKEADKYIKSIKDQSDQDKGIKFEITLSTGDTIHGYKVGPWRSHWEWYLNKKKKSNAEIYSELEAKMYSPYDRWKRQYDMLDKTYMYADDNRAYKSGGEHAKLVKNLYDKLSATDKKKADKYMEVNETNEPAYSTQELKPGDVVKVDGAAVTVGKITEVAGDSVISFEGTCDGQDCKVSYNDGQDGYAFIDQESGRFMTYAQTKYMR